MNKISEIFQSWVIAANPSKEEEVLAAKRHSICLDCKFIKNSFVFETKCGECGCPINKKIFSPKKGACRIGKWDEVDKFERIQYNNNNKNKSII
jgi:hypothetical protein